MKHWLLRRDDDGRPRILGYTRPHYSREARDVFARVGGMGTLVLHAKDEDLPQHLTELGEAFNACRLYANDALLEAIRHYCLVIDARSRGNVSQVDVARAESRFYMACREALGTDD